MVRPRSSRVGNAVPSWDRVVGNPVTSCCRFPDELIHGPPSHGAVVRWSGSALARRDGSEYRCACTVTSLPPQPAGGPDLDLATAMPGPGGAPSRRGTELHDTAEAAGRRTDLSGRQKGFKDDYEGRTPRGQRWPLASRPPPARAGTDLGKYDAVVAFETPARPRRAALVSIRD